MTHDRLRFGYNPGLPDPVRAAWGARLIVTQTGDVDVLWDRQDAIGSDEDRAAFLGLLNERYPLDRLRADLSAALKAYRVSTREAAEVVLYEDDDLRVIGNSNASHGYFYLTAHSKEFEPRGAWGEVSDALDALALSEEEE